jgi:excisionase family DNA binding protein
MSDLYRTREAASYLRVSEASVRRWADAGLIAVQRIGLRQERRFALADLERFAEAGRRASSQPSGPAEGEPPRGEAGLPATPSGAQLAVHDHVATFFDGDAGRLRVTLPFLREGLLAGQPCMLVASKSVADEYLQALSREPGVDIGAAVDSGAFVTRSGVGSSARAAAAGWEQLWWQALGRGASEIRVVGEMATYEGFSSVQEMLDYEVAYDNLAKRLPVMTICQYDVRHFDGPTTMAAIQAHPDMFSRRIADFLI